MKLEGSIQEIKEFIKEFQSKDTVFTKQQLSQIREEIQKTEIKKKGAEAPTLEELPQHTYPLHTCNNLPPKI